MRVEGKKETDRPTDILQIFRLHVFFHFLVSLHIVTSPHMRHQDFMVPNILFPFSLLFILCLFSLIFMFVSIDFGKHGSLIINPKAFVVLLCLTRAGKSPANAAHTLGVLSPFLHHLCCLNSHLGKAPKGAVDD